MTKVDPALLDADQLDLLSRSENVLPYLVSTEHRGCREYLGHLVDVIHGCDQ